MIILNNVDKVGFVHTMKKNGVQNNVVILKVQNKKTNKQRNQLPSFQTH